MKPKRLNSSSDSEDSVPLSDLMKKTQKSCETKKKPKVFRRIKNQASDSDDSNDYRFPSSSGNDKPSKNKKCSKIIHSESDLENEYQRESSSGYVEYKNAESVTGSTDENDEYDTISNDSMVVEDYNEKDYQPIYTSLVFDHYTHQRIEVSIFNNNRPEEVQRDKNLTPYEKKQKLTIAKLQEIKQEINSRPKNDKCADHPEGLKIDLMVHQLQGLEFMLWCEAQKNPCGIIADEMGKFTFWS